MPRARESGSAYEKVEHPASGFALVGAAALVQPDGSAAVALTGVVRERSGRWLPANLAGAR